MCGCGISRILGALSCLCQSRPKPPKGVFRNCFDNSAANIIVSFGVHVVVVWVTAKHVANAVGCATKEAVWIGGEFVYVNFF